MSYLKENDKLHMHHPHTFYVTDVLFQELNRPCGSMKVAEPFFGAKHKLYIFKTEALVMPNRICIGVFYHRNSEVSEIDFFLLQSSKHMSIRKKNDKDEDVTDGEDGRSPWAVLVYSEF